MIKVRIKKKEILITGHANYGEYGKDIVCASVSSIVITSVNAALRMDARALSYKEEQDKLIISILKEERNILVIINNMVEMLEELAQTYPKNIKIVKEEMS